MFAVLLQVVLAQPGIRDVLLFTWSSALKNQLLILGFAVPVLLGALGQIVPQLTKREWPCQTLLPFLTQLGFSLGTLLLALGWLWAGNAQAGALGNPATAFTVSLTDAQAGLKLALGGMVIMSAGVAAFALNALLLGWHSVRATLKCGAPDCAAGTAAEVAS
jgi:type II secretory pathway component PulF